MPGANQIDLESAASHEFGHALGLNHTQSTYCLSPRSTMCSTMSSGSTEFRSLETDDINGLVSIYP
jgi:predicted Zn-dependent protease